MTTVTSPFWVFTYAKGIGTRRGEERRWAMSLNLELAVRNSLQDQVGPVVPPARPFVAQAERIRDTEDVPWVHDNVYVVSDRVRLLLLEHCPGDCQFLPVDIRYRERSLGLTYFVMHALHTIDCADPVKSYSMHEPFLYHVRPHIIPERVPANIGLFRVANSFSSPVIRDSVRRALRRAKVTGCDFYLP